MELPIKNSRTPRRKKSLEKRIKTKSVKQGSRKRVKTKRGRGELQNERESKGVMGV